MDNIKRLLTWKQKDTQRTNQGETSNPDFSKRLFRDKLKKSRENEIAEAIQEAPAKILDTEALLNKAKNTKFDKQDTSSLMRDTDTIQSWIRNHSAAFQLTQKYEIENKAYDKARNDWEFHAKRTVDHWRSLAPPITPEKFTLERRSFICAAIKFLEEAHTSIQNLIDANIPTERAGELHLEQQRQELAKTFTRLKAEADPHTYQRSAEIAGRFLALHELSLEYSENNAFKDYNQVHKLYGVEHNDDDDDDIKLTPLEEYNRQKTALERHDQEVKDYNNNISQYNSTDQSKALEILSEKSHDYIIKEAANDFKSYLMGLYQLE